MSISSGLGFRPRKRRFLTSAIVGMFVGLTAALLGWGGAFAPLDAAGYDVLTRASAESLSADGIVLVTIDEEDLARFGQWPWPREIHAKAIQRLTSAGAKAVGLDILFEEPERGPSTGDTALEQAVAQSRGRVVLPLYGSRKILVPSQRSFAAAGAVHQPLPRLTQSGARLGHIMVVPDADGVVRRMPLRLLVDGQDVPSFALALYQAAGHGRIVDRPLDATGSYLLSFHNPASITRLHYRDILDAKELNLRGETVLVGVSAKGAHDFYSTPLTTRGNPAPGIELHAHALAALDGARIICETPRWLVWLIVPFGLLLSCIFTLLEPKQGTLVLGLAIVSLFASSWAGFRYAHTWWSPVTALLVAVTTYTTSIAQWYNEESRARRLTKATLQRYLAPQVVEEVLNNPSLLAPGGHREMAAVLFADLRGFTSYSERASSEEVVENLNRHLEVMARAVLGHGGMLDKFLGDAVMGVFTQGLCGQEYITRAVRAAIEIQQGQNNLSGPGERLRSLSIGIGIAAGEVVIGHVGIHERLEYTVVGGPANLASRLEEMAKPGEVLVDESVGGAFSDGLSDRGWVSIRGFAQPVRVFELKWNRGERVG